MPFTGSVFDPEKVNLMGRILGDAMREYEASTTTVPQGYTRDFLQRKMAQRLMAAVTAGELDPEKLKALALSAVLDR
jgi:hypothetical protein